MENKEVIETTEVVEEVENLLDRKPKPVFPMYSDSGAAVMMLVGLLCQMFTIKAFGYTILSINGISLLTGADTGSVFVMLFGLLLFAIPALLLCSIHIDKLKKYKKMFSYVLTFIGLFVLVCAFLYTSTKLSSLTEGYGTLSMSIGFWLYALGCALTIAIPLTAGETFDLDEIKSSVNQLSSTVVEVGGSLLSMDCPACGEKVSKNKNFCTACGKEMPKKVTCPKCETVAASGSAFCPKCGDKLPTE